MAHVSPSIDQNDFRHRNDDGSETTATYTNALNANWTQLVDTKFRVRFRLQEDNGAEKQNFAGTLEYNKGGAGWNTVTTSSQNVQAVASDDAGFVDGNDCTSGGHAIGSPFTPNAGQDEDGSAGGASCDFAGSDETEFEYCLTIVSGDVADGNTIQLRINECDTYGQTPTITVDKPAAVAKLDQVAFRAYRDDGGINNASVIGGSVVENSDWFQHPGTTVRLRFAINETNGVALSNETFQLQYSKNSGAWTDVNAASSNVRVSDVFSVADGTTITAANHRLTGGSGTARDGILDDGDGLTGNVSFSGSDHTEIEFGIEIVTADTSDGDTFDLRANPVTTADADVTYTQIPRMTRRVVTYRQTDFRFRDDDGNESSAGATFLAAENVNINRASDTNTRIRNRIAVENTTWVANAIYTLWYRKFTGTWGAWTKVTGTSNDVRIFDSTGLTNAQPTTDHGFTDTTGTFENKEGQEDVDGQWGGTQEDMPPDGYTIAEHCFQIRSADVNDGDLIELRTEAGQLGTDFAFYDFVGQITVGAAAGGSKGQIIGSLGGIIGG